MKKRSKLLFALFIILHIAGFLTSIRAIVDVRTSQGAIAWAISLNTFPSISLPAYWILGNSKFSGYVTARKAEVVEAQPIMRQLMDDFIKYGLREEENTPRALLIQRLAKMPFTKGNTAKLLIDGEETFDAIFKGIESAKKYILVQYYILKEDELGIKLQNALIKKAQEGVICLVIYDEVGSSLSKKYREAFENAGIRIYAFNTRQGKGNRFQINFRNHRKIVIADGEVAYVGGLNVGNEYLGLDPQMSPWRDTHVEVRGPVVQAVQLSFAEDWYWASKEAMPQLNWSPKQVPGGKVTALSLPTGPADKFETATLFFLDMINAAEKRLWVASPYFVPDEQIVSALQSAALKGVDVRVIIPRNPDNILVGLSAYSYLPELERAGVKVYKYNEGFMHQKVVLVDDDTSAIGTANFDNRSFRLNFEITMAMRDKDFGKQVEKMLLDDLSRSTRVSAAVYTQSHFLFRLAVSVSRLMAPLQ